MAGVAVEIYVFGDSIPEQAVTFFSNTAQQENISGWKGTCRVGNLLMIHKGNEACEALKELTDRRSGG